MTYQQPTSSTYNQPWSVVSDAELSLLRRLEKSARYTGGVTPEVHGILKALKELRK